MKLCAVRMPNAILHVNGLKSPNNCIHCIYKNSFWPAYSKLGMLGAIFTKVPAVTLNATLIEQTKSAASSLHSKTTSYERDDAFHI